MTMHSTLRDPELSDKFYAEFPDGVVPIRRTDHLYPDYNRNPVEALENTLTVFDYEKAHGLLPEPVTPWRLNELDKLITACFSRKVANEDRPWERASELVWEMFREGINPGDLARELGREPSTIIKLAVKNAGQGTMYDKWDEFFSMLRMTHSVAITVQHHPRFTPIVARRWGLRLGVVESSIDLFNTLVAEQRDGESWRSVIRRHQTLLAKNGVSEGVARMWAYRGVQDERVS